MRRRYALALDLADDPALIEEYERHHAHVWPEIEASLRAAGATKHNVGTLSLSSAKQGRGRVGPAGRRMPADDAGRRT